MIDENIFKNVKKASYEIANLSDEIRNKCLKRISEALLNNKNQIITANKIDLANAKLNGMKDSFIDRLTLDEKRISSLAASINNVIALPDYINNVLEDYTRPSGIHIKKVSVPFGVIASIFEARPNVAVDIAVLCLKTNNACVLKGGREAINTNMALVRIMKEAVKDLINPYAITLIEDTTRESTNELITKKEYIDLLIPRGGKGLISYIVANAKVPYIETGSGNCFMYVHESYDMDKAIKIAINAKHQRPSVCNAIENILVDEKVAIKFLSALYVEFTKLHIEMRGDEEVCSIINVNKASEEDYYTEYNDYIVALKVVKNIDEAIDFINSHSSHHSEVIVCEDEDAKNKFLSQIDSSCVYCNASTRFSDGGEFGFGAEIGISTSKLHARGPMGLKEITTYKYLIEGNGSVRE